MEGIVVKKVADDFWVKVQDSTFVCKPRGNLKINGIYVGDYVEISNQDNLYVVDKVNLRHNLLIRPPLANLQQIIIVISPIPKPDFNILDKLILFSYCYDITPIIAINKQDISKEVNDYVQSTYSSFVKVINVSAKSGDGIEQLKSAKGRRHECKRHPRERFLG